MRAAEIKEIIDTVKPGQFVIICYDKPTYYNEKEREAQADYFLEAMQACEGSERERYCNIFNGLDMGDQIVFDDEDDYYTYMRMTGQA